MGRRVVIEHGKVVYDSVIKVETKPLPKSKPPKKKTNRWFNFRVRFLECLGLLVATAFLGSITAVIITIVVLALQQGG